MEKEEHTFENCKYGPSLIINCDLCNGYDHCEHADNYLWEASDCKDCECWEAKEE